MNKLMLAALALASTSAHAQVAVPVSAPQPIVAQPAAAVHNGRSLTLPSNTEVLVRLEETLNTKVHEEGYTFNLSVTHDVVKDGYVVIPKGSRGVGEITWMTGKGMFGKSGKMDVEVRYVEVDGNRIPVVGKFRQEGRGNTVATIGAVVAIPVAGFFVTGHSGEMPSGRELKVFTKDDLTVALADTPAPAAPAIVTTPAAAPAVATPAETPAQSKTLLTPVSAEVPATEPTI